MTSKGQRLRPSPAMVVAFVALFVALTGTAFSVSSRVPGKNGVKSSDIARKAVKTADLARKAVKAGKLAGGAVTEPKLAANAVTSGKLAANAVTAGKLATNAVTGDKVAANALTGEKVAADSLTGANINYGSHIVAGDGNAEGENNDGAVCPPGEIATGGGGDSLDIADTEGVLASFPTPQFGPAPPTGWAVFYESNANAGEIIAYAVCMPA